MARRLSPQQTADPDVSPFPYFGPLEPDQVVGRDALIADLAQRLTDHRVTALLGPRRYGKTSVLRRVARDLDEVGPTTVWIDLYELSSMIDLAVAIDSGLAAARGPVRRAFDAMAASLSLRLGVVSLEFRRASRDVTAPEAVVRNLLDVLVRTSERHPLIVVFDEFSGIAAVKGGAGKLRTALQHHYQSLGIAFAGSHPSTMRALFADRAQPFFAQADIVEIGPLSDEDVTDIVHDGFQRTGRDAGPIVPTLIRFGEGHPQRLMQLADAVWRATPHGAAADESTWAAALGDVRQADDDGSERLFAVLPTGQQRALRAIAADGRVYGAAAGLVDLPSGSARTALTSLLGDGHVLRRGDRLAVVDPLFGDWLRRRLPIPG